MLPDWVADSWKGLSSGQCPGSDCLNHGMTISLVLGDNNSIVITCVMTWDVSIVGFQGVNETDKSLVKFKEYYDIFSSSHLNRLLS